MVDFEWTSRSPICHHSAAGPCTVWLCLPLYKALIIVPFPSSLSTHSPLFVTTIMMFFFLLASIYSLLSLVSAFPVVRDVWVPPIISPNASTVWVAGRTYPVTWNTSSEPSQVTNPQGMVYLRLGNATQASPIAQGFPLSAGEVNVTIPADTQPSSDWMVVRESIFQQSPTRDNK